MAMPPQADRPLLRRDVGIFGAVMMGLGSIIGTGVFVSIGIAAGVTGPAVVLALVVAAVVAACNGLSSAQLAANHPVSGATYEYGYRWLTPSLGFTAGWMFLCAKTASAATAALGFGGYVLSLFGQADSSWQIPLGLAAVVVLTVLVLAGIRRSTAANVVIVSITLAALTIFVVAGLPTALRSGGSHLTPLFDPVDPHMPPLQGFLQACALMFVAYTGYGRIATLGEEIREPRRNIPPAIVLALIISLAIYVAVASVAIAAVGATEFSKATARHAAPLEIVAKSFTIPGVPLAVAIGAITAMLGVLLNLILGMSRVVLAMARRRDLPAGLAHIHRSSATPTAAVIVVSAVIAALVLIGNVKTTWSFSAFTVLIYYAITNLAALRLSDQERLYPRFIAWVGLAACLSLAMWVERPVWLAGLGLIAAGLVWHAVARWLASAGSG
jgi:APA family basic amino acid/polyamine antiporter